MMSDKPLERPIRQPVPSVSAADVERITRRDFPPEQVAEVLAILAEYGSEEWQREEDRVRLAVLKLANRNMKDLRYWIEQAKRDYRDVLGPAEYPQYGRSRGPQDKIIESDWAQYEKWLKS